mmetsp:Transcript_22754/g.52144  ORF Transcript_22754/g.52144 Transcript_22754/m.52144 type:complete len:174 (+) Transcript_22754:1060-1581(+)
MKAKLAPMLSEFDSATLRFPIVSETFIFFSFFISVRLVKLVVTVISFHRDRLKEGWSNIELKIVLGDDIGADVSERGFILVTEPEGAVKDVFVSDTIGCIRGIIVGDAIVLVGGIERGNIGAIEGTIVSNEIDAAEGKVVGNDIGDIEGIAVGDIIGATEGIVMDITIGSMER